MNFRQSLAQVLLGFFLFVMLYPMTKSTFSLQKSAVRDYDVAFTLWSERLPELYLQIVFLGASVIASLLVIRKPPSYSDIELRRYGLEDEL